MRLNTERCLGDLENLDQLLFLVHEVLGGTDERVHNFFLIHDFEAEKSIAKLSTDTHACVTPKDHINFRFRK